MMVTHFAIVAVPSRLTRDNQGADRLLVPLDHPIGLGLHRPFKLLRQPLLLCMRVHPVKIRADCLASQGRHVHVPFPRQFPQPLKIATR